MKRHDNSVQNSLLRRLGGWLQRNGDQSATRAVDTPLGVDEVRGWLRRVLATRLDLPLEAIDTARNFEEYGLDSRTAVGVSGELEEWLGKPLSPTLLWDCPTIDAVATHLAATEGVVEE
jgi:acyl carrier protein